MGGFVRKHLVAIVFGTIFLVLIIGGIISSV